MTPSPAGEQAAALADTLAAAYGLRAVDITRIPAGTATDNYVVTERGGDQWFAKVYPDTGALECERDALALADFARAGRVPVPRVRRAHGGQQIAHRDRLAVSVWEYVADAVTAEGGLIGRRWVTVGSVLGRLHRQLAQHPAATPAVRLPSVLVDVGRARSRYDRLIDAYERRRNLEAYEAWCLEAARERRDLLDTVPDLLARLPELTEQIVHGDLAAPNVLMRGDDVAALIDFQPPSPRLVSWEIARIGCDPRTLLHTDDWVGGLVELLDAYRAEHPAARVEDLAATVAVGCAYTLASTFPLGESLKQPATVDPALQAYGRARHEVALDLLENLTEVQAVVAGHL